MNSLINQVYQGNTNPGTGNKKIIGLKSVYEARGRKGARLYFKEENGTFIILAKFSKVNQQKPINILKRINCKKYKFSCIIV